MTLITFQDGKPVLRDGKVGTEQECCCDCAPCPKCSLGCLSVTFAGFEGNPEAECDECANLNGTYTLIRGSGVKPSISLSVSATSGSGASLTATLAFDKAAGTYSVDSVTVNNGGSGYSPDATVLFTVTDGIVACGNPPFFSVEVERTQPTLNVSGVIESSSDAPLGSGAVLEPVYSPLNTTSGQETWGLSGVTVTSGGTDYEDGDAIEIVLTKGTQITKAKAYTRIAHWQPIIDAITVESAGGAGAVLTPTWTLNQDLKDFYDGLNANWDGRFWYISALLITAAGSGYAVGDEISYTLSGTHRTSNGPNTGPYVLGTVGNVNGSGAITAINFAPPVWSQYKSDGAIQSVYVEDEGEYYTLGGIVSVTVTNPGTIWPGSTCEYSLCQPTTCLYGSETKCRKISLLIGGAEHTLTVTLDGEEPPLLEATMPAEGTSCDDLEFSPGAISAGACTTIGSVTVASGECSGPPSEDSCCGAAGCCCIDNQKDPTKKTQQQCEAAGGTWNAGENCVDSCFCCAYKSICVEQVWSYYQFNYTVKNQNGQVIRQSDMIPASQPAGTVFVWSTFQFYQPGTGVVGCAGTSPGRQNRFGDGHCYINDVCNEWTTAYGTQWYYRARIVDDCEQCSGTPYDYPFVEPGTEVECDGYTVTWDTPCFTGADVVSCDQMSIQSCIDSINLRPCAESLGLSICADGNPLP